VKQWDTADFSFPHGLHPCVILSPSARCENPDFETVNVLACSSHRSARKPRIHEAMLDSADGMDWETLVRLDAIWMVRKDSMKRHRGVVSRERQRELGRKIIALFGLAA